MSTSKAAGSALWQGHTFTYGSLTITVHRKTVGDMMRRDSIRDVLKDMPSESGVAAFATRGFAEYFARIVTQTDAVEGPLTLPSPSAPEADLKAAFADFCAWDGNLVDSWIGALYEVDRAPGEAAYWPKERLSEAELKKVPPAG